MADPGPDDPLRRLPPVPRQIALIIAGPTTGAVTLGPGIAFTVGRHVVLSGAIQLDEGPADGLETVACLDQGKYHESLVRLDAGDGQAIKVACVAALDLRDGVGAPELSGLPARGAPLRLSIEWQDERGWRRCAVSCLVRDHVTDAGYPPLPFVYTGSRFAGQGLAGERRALASERFMLDQTRSLAVAYDDDDALLASPFPDAQHDVRFEVNTALAPLAGTPVRLVIERAELPGRLLARGGVLSGADGRPLDDDALAARLKEWCGGWDGRLHAVAVAVAADEPRERDVAVRAHLITVAARAGVWATPVFVPLEVPRTGARPAP